MDKVVALQKILYQTLVEGKNEQKKTKDKSFALFLVWVCKQVRNTKDRSPMTQGLDVQSRQLSQLNFFAYHVKAMIYFIFDFNRLLLYFFSVSVTMKCTQRII